MTTAKDIMHRGVECVEANTNLTSAARMMRDLGVGALPICGEDGKLKGIITDRDIVVKCIAAGHDPSKVTASELAQGTPQWIDADADISEAVRQMTRHRIKRLPVIENKRLVGMISEADLAQKLPEDQLAEFVEKVFTPH